MRETTHADMHGPSPTPRRYTIGDDDDTLRQGIANGTIPSTVVDSGCTSGVGTTKDPCHRTGRTSNKEFILPGGEIMAATEIAEYPFNVRDPAKQLHITPGITTNSLLSTSKFAEANYITILAKKKLIYMMRTTQSLPSQKVQSYGVSNVPRQDCGAFLSSKWFVTTIRTQSSQIDRPPNSYQHAHPQPTPSTMPTNSRHNQS